MKKITNKLLVSAITMLVLVGVIATNFTSCKKKEPETIKIGAILPLTGPAASLGEWFKMGYILAQEEANQTLKDKNTKISLKILIEDGMGDPKVSVNLYKKLREIDKINYLTSTLSPICLSLKPLAIKDSILFFANAAHPLITGDSLFVFRHSNTVEQEGELIINFIKDKFSNINNIVVFASNEDFGISFLKFISEKFKELKIRNIATELYEKDQKDFRSLVIKPLKSSPPDIVIVIGFVKPMGLLIKTLREVGYKGPIVANFGFTDPNVIQLASDAAIGVYHTDYNFDYSAEPLKHLNEKSFKMFHKELPPAAILAYNTIMILTEAISNAGIKSIDIASYIKNKKEFYIGNMKILVTEKGDILPPLTIRRYEKK